jgi:LPS-assembly protein
LTYASPYANRRLNYGLTGRFDYFTRGNDVLLDSINATRYDVYPTISIPFNTLSYFFEPKAGVRLTRYSLDENKTFSDTRPDRFLPFFSLDSGLFLERYTQLFGEQILQTLEPRFYYLYVPKEEQTDLPVFDTGQTHISFASLFRDNRFTGIDRIGDANQLTASATTRFYSEMTGHQFAYFSLGQTFYLEDPTVVLPGWDLPTGNRSAIITEAGAIPFDELELRAEFQWDPNLDLTRKLSLSAMYRPGPGKVINIGYRDHKPNPYDTDINKLIRVEQTDISIRWPVRPDLSVVGKWNYAIETDRSLDLFAGIEYNSCCWGVRVVGRRFLSNIEGEFDSGVFLQFELKGLAGIGEKTVDFLSRSIPGYESEF